MTSFMHKTAMEFARTAVPQPLMTPPPAFRRWEVFVVANGGCMLFLFIGVGGAMGALARHGLITWINSRAGTAFPWGTLTVNLIGSFLIGALMGYVGTSPMSPALRTLLAVGLLGSFTTFSTYALETVSLVRDGFAMRAAIYAFGSLVLGAAAVCAGLFSVVQSVGAR